MPEEIPTIYVGKKPLIRYMMAAISILLNERPEKLKISARGRMISKAVDVAEMLKTRYLPGIIEIEAIKTGTEELESPNQPGRVNRVSTIEIILKRTGEIQITK
ncbi:MAG: DNA/RNA-binding protein AlbA [Candidatus Njordarchaeota archaeon]